MRAHPKAWMAQPVGIDGTNPVERCPREPKPHPLAVRGTTVRCPICNGRRTVVGSLDQRTYWLAEDGVQEGRCSPCGQRERYA